MSDGFWYDHESCPRCGGSRVTGHAAGCRYAQESALRAESAARVETPEVARAWGGDGMFEQGYWAAHDAQDRFTDPVLEREVELLLRWRPA